MKFIEHDFGGTLVHELLENDGAAAGGRCTRCRIDTKYYPGSQTDDSSLVVTCLRCLVGDVHEPRALSSGARTKRPATR